MKGTVLGLKIEIRRLEYCIYILSRYTSSLLHLTREISTKIKMEFGLQHQYQNKQDFFVHYQNHQTFSCSQCGFQYYTQEELNKHMNNFHNRFQIPRIKVENGTSTYSCKVCAKTVQSLRSLKRHMKNVHGIEDNFPIPVSLQDSQDKVSKNDISPQTQSNLIRCDDCGKTFNKAYRLKEHILVHSSGTHPCPSCNFKFKRDYDLKRHMARMKYRKCNYCGEFFQCKYGLENHKITNHGHSGVLDGRAPTPENSEEYTTESNSTTTMLNPSYSATLDERCGSTTPENDYSSSDEVKTIEQKQNGYDDMNTDGEEMQQNMDKVHAVMKKGFMEIEVILNKIKNIIER